MPKTDNSKKIDSPSAARFFLVMLLVIFALEAAIMLFLYFFLSNPRLPPLLEGFLDSFTLAVLLIPVLYFLFYRPLSLEITRYKQALKAVDELETSYRVIIQTARDGFWLTDSRGRILDTNDAYCLLSGYSRQELLTMSVSDVDAQEKPEDTERHIYQIIEVGSDRFETKHRGKDGRIADMEVSVNYLDRAGGQFFSFLRDITERKQTEIALEGFSVVVRQAADLVLITDKNGKIEYVNPAFERQTGYKIEEVIGKTPRILKSGSHDKVFYERLWDTILSGEVFRGILVNKKKNGELYYSEKTITPIKDGQGNIINFVSTDKDITERKRYEEELIQANQELLKLDRMKNEFIVSVSHELRTPIGIMREGISQVSEGLHGALTQDQQYYLGKSLGHLDRLTKIVNSILDVSSLEAGKIGLHLEPVDLAALARQIAGIFEPVANNKGLEIRMDFTGEQITLPLDKDKIGHVFTNLIENAIKFTGQGSIKIQIQEKADCVECSVSDTGRGMPAEALARAFDKFQQFGRTFGPGEKGVGLGLAIAQGLVEMHKGKTWIESELGKGTRVSFSLPKR